MSIGDLEPLGAQEWDHDPIEGKLLGVGAVGDDRHALQKLQPTVVIVGIDLAQLWVLDRIGLALLEPGERVSGIVQKGISTNWLLHCLGLVACIP